MGNDALHIPQLIKEVKFKPHLIYIKDIYRYVEIGDKVIEPPKDIGNSYWVEVDSQGNIIDYSKLSFTLDSYKQKLKVSGKRVKTGKSLELHYSAPYKVVQYEPDRLFRGDLDDYIDFLIKMKSNAPDWLTIWFCLDFYPHYNEETHEHFITRHCNLVTISIDFYEKILRRRRSCCHIFQFRRRWNNGV